ncbi:glycerophosphodiester phosphodiesterase family protein [Corynebacterium freiburgense]|uniref:glycerophosphodiester phosphodiesterase family protein n=1 Tax=Corynebacterium freiburgense TaxID=556548 RepID=UPI000420C322|nr:glycerophosphodiester phosphodiesterase family protein [Corynebacterium freiburgense]WJZ03255.1 Glycerophosphoryl diester phosphodiesterase [Corynebacterium freiburgense]
MPNIRKRRIALLLTLLLVGFMWANNTNVFTTPSNSQQGARLLAHRGLAQTFRMDGITDSTNTAALMNPPEHPYLENTIPSMQAAFDAGAAVVELDLKLTKDKALAVFHDATLDHRTNGVGQIGDYTMDELQRLDIGYGYTADGGKTYPFRGKGIGMMPSFTEVLHEFPNHDLLIHIKDGQHETYQVLLKTLDKLPKHQQQRLTIYGNDDGIAWLRSQNPQLRLLSKTMLQSALLKYEFIGWTGYIPKELHNMELHIPAKYAPLLWGWPQTFVNRMEHVNTRVVLVAGNGTRSEGFDTPTSMQQIPPDYTGYIWTNRIDLVGKAIH